MTIGVLADTHIPLRRKAIPMSVLRAFENVDHIIHAGDITEAWVLAALEALAPVTAVWGNRDSEELKAMLPERCVVELGGARIGVFHGHGEGGTTERRIPTFFPGERLHCVVFGHSHVPFAAVLGGTLYVNPGSPTDARRPRQVGILTVGEAVGFRPVPVGE